MKLSEAILLGSVGTGQCRWVLQDRQGNTCALGAALKAQGIQIKQHAVGHMVDNSPDYAPVYQLWPWVTKRIPHPTQPGVTGTVAWIITTLNDRYRWSRPRIAAWVAELEQAQEAQVGQVEVTEKVVA